MLGVYLLDRIWIRFLSFVSWKGFSRMNIQSDLKILALNALCYLFKGIAQIFLTLSAAYRVIASTRCPWVLPYDTTCLYTNSWSWSIAYWVTSGVISWTQSSTTATHRQIRCRIKVIMRSFRLCRCLLLKPRPARISLLLHNVILSGSCCCLRRRWCYRLGSCLCLSRRSIPLRMGQACVSFWWGRYSLLSLISWRPPGPQGCILVRIFMLLLKPAEGCWLSTVWRIGWMLGNSSLRAVVTWEICSRILGRRLRVVSIATPRSRTACRCISFNHSDKRLLRRIELLVCRLLVDGYRKRFFLVLNDRSTYARSYNFALRICPPKLVAWSLDCAFSTLTSEPTYICIGLGLRLYVPWAACCGSCCKFICWVRSLPCSRVEAVRRTVLCGVTVVPSMSRSRPKLAIILLIKVWVPAIRFVCSYCGLLSLKCLILSWYCCLLTLHKTCTSTTTWLSTCLVQTTLQFLQLLSLHLNPWQKTSSTTRRCCIWRLATYCGKSFVLMLTVSYWWRNCRYFSLLRHLFWHYW